MVVQDPKKVVNKKQMEMEGGEPDKIDEKMATEGELSPEEMTQDKVKEDYMTMAEQESGTVRYVGAATRRLISDDDWTKAGAVEDKDVEFNENNLWTLPLTDFSQDAINYFKSDNGFRVVE